MWRRSPNRAASFSPSIFTSSRVCKFKDSCNVTSAAIQTLRLRSRSFEILLLRCSRGRSKNLLRSIITSFYVSSYVLSASFSSKLLGFDSIRFLVVFFVKMKGRDARMVFTSGCD